MADANKTPGGHAGRGGPPEPTRKKRGGAGTGRGGRGGGMKPIQPKPAAGNEPGTQRPETHVPVPVFPGMPGSTPSQGIATGSQMSPPQPQTPIQQPASTPQSRPSSLSRSGATVMGKNKINFRLEEVFPNVFLELTRANFVKVSGLPPPKVQYPWQDNRVPVSDQDWVKIKVDIDNMMRKIAFVFCANRISGTIVKEVAPQLDPRTYGFHKALRYTKDSFNAFKHEILFERVYDTVIGLLNDYGTTHFRYDVTVWGQGNSKVSDEDLRVTKEFLYSRMDRKFAESCLKPVFTVLDWDKSFNQGRKAKLATYYLRQMLGSVIRKVTDVVVTERDLPANQGRTWHHKFGSWRISEDSRRDARVFFESLAANPQFSKVELSTFIWKDSTALAETPDFYSHDPAEVLRGNLISNSPPPSDDDNEEEDDEGQLGPTNEEPAFSDDDEPPIPSPKKHAPTVATPSILGNVSTNTPQSAFIDQDTGPGDDIYGASPPRSTGTKGFASSSKQQTSDVGIPDPAASSAAPYVPKFTAQELKAATQMQSLTGQSPGPAKRPLSSMQEERPRKTSKKTLVILSSDEDDGNDSTAEHSPPPPREDDMDPAEHPLMKAAPIIYSEESIAEAKAREEIRVAKLKAAQKAKAAASAVADLEDPFVDDGAQPAKKNPPFSQAQIDSLNAPQSGLGASQPSTTSASGFFFGQHSGQQPQPAAEPTQAKPPPVQPEHSPETSASHLVPAVLLASFYPGAPSVPEPASAGQTMSPDHAEPHGQAPSVNAPASQTSPLPAMETLGITDKEATTQAEEQQPVPPTTALPPQVFELMTTRSRSRVITPSRIPVSSATLTRSRGRQAAAAVSGVSTSAPTKGGVVKSASKAAGKPTPKTATKTDTTSPKTTPGTTRGRGGGRGGRGGRGRGGRGGGSGAAGTPGNAETPEAGRSIDNGFIRSSITMDFSPFSDADDEDSETEGDGDDSRTATGMDSSLTRSRSASPLIQYAERVAKFRAAYS